MSRAASISYDIGKPAGLCAATEQPIPPGAAYIAALVEPAPDQHADAADDSTTDDDRLARLDLSADAWDRGYRPERLFAFWRTTMKETAAEQDDGLDAANLLELFDNLEDADDHRRLAFRFVLALMLIRSRSLRQVGTPDDRPGMLVVRKGDPPEAAVLVEQPELDADALRSVTEQVRRVMNMDR